RTLDPQHAAALVRGRLGPPLVADVRQAFLVAGAVAVLDRAQPAPLVEAAGPLVDRERPEGEARRSQLHRLLEERGTEPAAVEVRVNVEMPERAFADCR